MALRLATGPVCWGVDFADDVRNPPWPAVLDAIAATGIRAIELGPLGYLPRDPARLRAALAQRGLAAAGSFVFEPLHDRRQRARVLAVARATCELVAAVGGERLVVIDLVEPERAATAGRPEAVKRLEEPRWRDLVATTLAIGELARDEFGLRAVLHPHAGSHLELEDEVERALAELPASAIGLCLDTGHCAYAGIDPVALHRRHAARVELVHLKDVDASLRARAVEQRADLWAAIALGAFCRVGAGCVDFAALGRALDDHGYDGWATLEQDRRSGSLAQATADVTAGRLHLEAAGLIRAPDGAAT